MKVLLLVVLSSAAFAQRGPQGEDARVDRVMKLAVEATPAACRAIRPYLTDDSYDIRNRAANALYWRCDRAAASGFTPLLCRSIEMGNAEAGTVLLLGYGKAEEVAGCLGKVAARKEMVKLTLGSKPVPIALAAAVPRARFGEPEELRKAFRKPDLPTALFLLGVLRDIEDPEALRAARAFLDDEREAPGVVAHGTRRVRDVALEALVGRFGLKVSFAIAPGREYAPAEVAEVRSALLGRN